MDYEKKYKEALEKARKLYEQGTITESLCYVFPELKESEDDRILKHLKAVVKAYDMWAERGLDMNDILAWLEKQGGQKQDPCDNCKDVMLNCHNFPCTKKRAFKQGKSVFDIINEEKVDNANKVKPKFHQGDWVILMAGELSTTLQIVKVDTNKRLYWFNDSSYLPIVDEECLQRWTIQDAKDGDVLNSPSHHLIWIYKDNEHFYAYVTKNVAIDGLIKIPSDACPATKEQRKQLEKAMTDAGYAFNFDKKELKKIVVPKFKIGDTMRTLQEASNGITSGLPVIISIDNEYYHCNNELIAIKNQDNYEYPPMNRRQKPAWSEEDENLLNISVENLTELKDRFGKNYGRVGDCINWLKSLKDRCTWSPSDEQMKAFENFVRGIWESCYDSPYENNAKLLYSLLEQLKKLK